MMKDKIKLCFIFLFSKIFSNISYKKSKKKFIEYNNNEYLSLVSAKDIKDKKIFFERDGVFFDQPQFQPLVHLPFFLDNQKQFKILDIGGGLGTNFYNNLMYIKPFGEIEWCIVEKKEIVEFGKKNISSIVFFNDLNDALEYRKYDLVIFGSSLQYLKNYSEILDKLTGLKIKNILILRTPFASFGKHQEVIQFNKSSKISYSSFIFSFIQMTNYFKLKNYIFYDHNSGIDPNNLFYNFKRIIFKNILFRVDDAK